ncbi:unnamed protein product [marine sediment metagenome]|uniref:Uncharacterized protein n=1 Tax=marine sediment metagenome TaxID=412755 RepID=X1MXY4_9ZZZZ
MKNKIGWCNLTFNPVWGCLNVNKCEYCYARKIAKRFAGVRAKQEYDYRLYQTDEEICQGLFASRLRHFLPTFLESQFDKKFPQKPKKYISGRN